MPSAPNVGSPAVPPSARNKLQKYNSNETQTGFECMTVIFIKRLLKTFRDFQRLSETYRHFQRNVTFYIILKCDANSHLNKGCNLQEQLSQSILKQIVENSNPDIN